MSGWFYGLSWLCVLGRFGWLIVGGFGLLFRGLSFGSGGSSGDGFHTTSKKKVVHIFFEVGSFSTGVKSLFFVLDGLIIIVDSETSANFRHFFQESI